MTKENERKITFCVTSTRMFVEEGRVKVPTTASTLGHFVNYVSWDIDEDVCCVCQKHDHASSNTRTLDSCFGLIEPHEQGQCRVILEPEEHCPFITK